MKRGWIAAILILCSAILTARSTDPGSLWSEFQARHGAQWRIHRTEHGFVRSMYGQSPVAGNRAEQAAQSFVKDAAGILDVDSISDLRLASIDRSAEGTDLRYMQYFGGLPVAGGEVTVHLDRYHRVIAATSSYRSHLRPGSTQLSPVAVAQKTALRFLKNKGSASSGGLWIVASGGEARPAWRFEASSSEIQGGSYLLYVDAEKPSTILRVHRTEAAADGQGSIYLENPVVTPERSTQTFKYLTSGSLSGKFVKTYNANFERSFSSFADLTTFTTASDPARQYNYDTGDARFAEAMAYFHATRVHDQWRSFGFNKLNVQIPVFVNVMTATGQGYDNASYRRFTTFSRYGAIVMGAGDELENLGWDADVYYHEYGHAVLDRAKPGFFETYESNYPSSFHEAFGDISAAAITGNSRIAEFGLRLKASKKFVGRELDNKNSYPKDVILPSFKRSESHYTGMIIGGAWWDLQKSLGRPAAQRLLYRSLPMIPNDMTFFDVRDAMLTADGRLNGGANTMAIQQAFSLHGLGGSDPGQNGTVLVTALKTAGLQSKNGATVIQFKTSFNKGDLILVFANYTGSNLTPGYFLIGENVAITGPAGSTIDAFFDADEVANGPNSGRNGVVVADVGTYSDTKPGRYTLSLQGRLGGTSTLTPVKTVSFQIK